MWRRTINGYSMCLFSKVLETCIESQEKQYKVELLNAVKFDEICMSLTDLRFFVNLWWLVIVTIHFWISQYSVVWALIWAVSTC